MWKISYLYLLNHVNNFLLAADLWAGVFGFVASPSIFGLQVPYKGLKLTEESSFKSWVNKTANSKLQHTLRERELQSPPTGTCSPPCIHRCLDTRWRHQTAINGHNLGHPRENLKIVIIQGFMWSIENYTKILIVNLYKVETLLYWNI